MGNQNKPVLMQEDMELMLSIAKHGFVDMDYVYLFNYPGRKKRTISDRINQLSKFGFLSINKTFIPPDYTISYRIGYRIISLGRQGIHLLDGLGYDVIDNIKIVQSASPYRMYHQVQVSTVCDLLKKSYDTGESNWHIAKILNEKEAYLEEALNQPDALLVFHAKGKEDIAMIVFLEIERSYASLHSLERKIKGYQFAIHNQLYSKALKEKTIDQRVLFVAQTQKQKDALLSKIRRIEGSEKISLLVAGYGELTEDPLNAIYITPNDEVDRYKLLGKLV